MFVLLLFCVLVSLSYLRINLCLRLVVGFKDVDAFLCCGVLSCGAMLEIVTTFSANLLVSVPLLHGQVQNHKLRWEWLETQPWESSFCMLNSICAMPFPLPNPHRMRILIEAHACYSVTLWSKPHLLTHYLLVQGVMSLPKLKWTSSIGEIGIQSIGHVKTGMQNLGCVLVHRGLGRDWQMWKVKTTGPKLKRKRVLLIDRFPGWSPCNS